MFENLSWLDLAALALMVGFGIVGAVRGAVRTVVMLVAVTAGGTLAGRYGADLGASDWPLVADLPDSEKVGVGVGCAAVFVAVLLAGMIVAWLLRKLVANAELGLLDRLLGLVAGAAKGALIAAVIAVAALSLDMPSIQAGLPGSHTVAGTRELFEAVREWMPTEVADWLAERLAEPGDGAQRLGGITIPR